MLFMKRFSAISVNIIPYLYSVFIVVISNAHCE